LPSPPLRSVAPILAFVFDPGERVAWILRLVKIGADGEGPALDVMEVNRPDDFGDIADLGLRLEETKRLVAGLQQEIVAHPGQGPRPARAARLLTKGARANGGGYEKVGHGFRKRRSCTLTWPKSVATTCSLMVPSVVLHSS
jgi:hypothetical protein